MHSNSMAMLLVTHMYDEKYYIQLTHLISV